MCSSLNASGWFWIVWSIYEWVESVAGRPCSFVLGSYKKYVEDAKNRCLQQLETPRFLSSAAALLGLSPGLPGEVLLQRHHLLSAPLRRCPLLSLHTQMLCDLQLRIIALLDQCRRCRCRQTRQQFTLNPTGYNPSEGLQRHIASVQSFSLLNWTGNRSSTSCELILIIWSFPIWTLMLLSITRFFSPVVHREFIKVSGFTDFKLLTDFPLKSVIETMNHKHELV